jgi:hypothetical protein
LFANEREERAVRVPLFEPTIIRIRPCGLAGEPPRVHKRQAHHPSTVDLVRSYIEGTTWSHRLIAKKTKVNPGTISRWQARHGWRRPPGACRPAPRPEAARHGPNLAGRALARALLVEVERLVVEIAACERVDPARAREALDLLARARAEDKIRRGKRLKPPENPPPPRRKPKRKPGDPPIRCRSRRALNEALRRMEGSGRG